MADLRSIAMGLPEDQPSLTKPSVESEPTSNLLAQAIIGLAPLLAGAALGGARGGAIGGEAGLSGLSQLTKAQQLEQERKAQMKKEERAGVETALRLKSEARLAASEERKASAEEKRLALAEAAERRNQFAALEKLGLDKQELALKEKQLEQKAKEEKKLSAQEYASGTYARRLEQAESVFNSLEQQGYDRASIGQGFKSMLPQRLQDNALKAQTQAERNFVNAVLRRESGAAISQAEFANAEQQYFPRAGDTPDQAAIKKANRMQVLAGLQAEGKKALEQIPLVPVPLPRLEKTEIIPSAQAAPKPKMIQQGGHVYKLNQATGEYE